MHHYKFRPRNNIVSLLVLLVTGLLLQGIDHVKANSGFRDENCGVNQALVRIEIKMDDKPEETNWFFLNYLKQGVAMIITSGQSESVTDTLCVDRSGCYIFEIRDFGGDGICCDSGNGYYKISYDNETIGEGGEFQSNDDRANSVGDGCPSIVTPTPPSVSAAPTTTRPSVSTSPTISPMPTTVRSSSSPTSTESLYLIKKDDKRRYFPQRPTRQEGKFPFQPLPDCNSTDTRVGCVAVPVTIQSLPDWAGKIHYTPPSCSKKTQSCELELPATKNTHSKTPLFHNDLWLDQRALPGGNSSTHAIAVGDLDGNGFAEIVFANDVTQFSQILWNMGKESSLEPSELELTNFSSPLTQSVAVALGDFDNDGWLDIVVGNYQSHNELLMNNGDGTFREGMLFPQGSQNPKTQSIAVGDVNNDGWLDIVLGNNGRRNQLFLNKGDGTFHDPVPLSDTENTATHAIKLGDLNLDGWLDIVIGNAVARGQNNQILMNGKNGTFLDAVHFPGESLTTYSIALADVNGDGFIDIIEGNDVDQKNRVLINNRANSGTEFSNDKNSLIDLEGNARDIAAADINGDGSVDIILGNNGQYNHLLINNGDGNFTKALRLPGRASFSRSIAVTDLDNDGDADIILGFIVNEQNLIFMNNEQNWAYEQNAVFLRDSAGATMDLVFSDFTGDGWVDIVTGKTTRSNLVALNKGDGTHDYPAKITERDKFVTLAIESADLNGDGYVDLIIGNNNESNQVFWNTGDGDGKFHYEPLSFPDKKKTNTIALGDLDGNGHVDIVFGNENDSNQILMNIGNGTFLTALTVGGGSLKTEAIVLGDLNGDGWLDLVIGNHLEDNQVLINNGDGTFREAITLINSTDMATTSLALADLNGDSRLDLVVGNKKFQENFVYWNDFNAGGGTFSDPVALPGDATNTHSVALGDLDGDGQVDIVIGNWYGPNQALLNGGNGVFDNVMDLPGGRLSTDVIRLADLDADGFLDIGVGNTVHNDQLIYFSSCPNGGARLHPKSWCFRCPKFMGRVSISSGVELSTCKECLRDHMQQSGGSELCADSPCVLSTRNFSEDNCSRCPNGTYFNTDAISRDEYDPSTWEEDPCEQCPPGEYATESLNAINECFKCLQGTFQNTTGASECFECGAGTFQAERGQSECDDCPIGGYCKEGDTCGGGFEKCPPGTYNDLPGESSEEACRECPVGTYSFETGSNSSEYCHECPKGSYNNKTGRTGCELCPKGSNNNETGRISCDLCEKGTYADKKGLTECIPCPYRLSSADGKDTCAFCDSGFYLNNTSASIPEIFQRPDTLCLDCPSNADCQPNTTLRTLGIPRNHWRDSSKTSKTYVCNHDDICEGSNSTKPQSQRQIDNGDFYCKKGHKGPLCEVCVDEEYYFNGLEGKCSKCPSASQLVPQALGIVTALIVFLFLIRFAIKRTPLVTATVSSLSLRAKFKIFVSFYQVANSLDGVYGVRIDKKLKERLNFLKMFSLDLDIFEFIILPKECIGSMQQQLIFGAVLPYVIIALGIVGIYAAQVLARSGCTGKHRGSEESYLRTANLKRASIYWTISVFYFALPSVSRHCFDARKCRAFETNEKLVKSRSYLIADPNIQCDSTDEQYSSLKNLFTVFFTLWPSLTPFLFLVLLMSVSQSIRNKTPSALADACRFLWEDYDESMLFWDVLDTWRKIFLTGFIMFIDPEQGSNKSFRLTVATVVSSFYLGILSIQRPFKRFDDLCFSFVSNFLLICCFSMGITLQLCDESDDCDTFVGLSLNSYRASALVATLTIAMLVITLIFLAVMAFVKIRTPIIRLVKTRYPPNLEMPPNCTHHVFMSHVWSTGQDKTFSIVNKLNLALPILKIWLDINNLHDVSKLEDSVSESAIFILYYSKGYFRSKNCQRELYTAVKMEKPVIVLHEGDEASVLNELKNECDAFCHKEPGSVFILEHILKNDPIRWLSEGPFCAATMNRIYSRLLSYLPYYQNTRKQILDEGIMVPGELNGPISLPSMNLLVCISNNGALGIAEEIHAMLPTDKVNIHFVRKARAPLTLKKNQEYDAAHGTGSDITAQSGEMWGVQPNSVSNDAKSKEIFDPLLSKVGRSDDNVQVSHDGSAIEVSSYGLDFEALTINRLLNEKALDEDLSYSNLSHDEKLEGDLSYECGKGWTTSNISLLRKKRIPTYDLSSYNPSNGERSVLVLYLNRDLFLEDENNLKNILQSTKAMKIPIVLVHEQDNAKGGCPFETFFDQTPQDLIDPPYELFKELAIPLYTTTEYRTVSLRQIINTIGKHIVDMELAWSKKS